MVPLAFLSRSQERPASTPERRSVIFDCFWSQRARIFISFLVQINVTEHRHEDDSITEIFWSDVWSFSFWVFLNCVEKLLCAGSWEILSTRSQLTLRSIAIWQTPSLCPSLFFTFWKTLCMYSISVIVCCVLSISFPSASLSETLSEHSQSTSIGFPDAGLSDMLLECTELIWPWPPWPENPKLTAVVSRLQVERPRSGCSGTIFTLSPCELSWESHTESLDVSSSIVFTMQIDTSSVLVLPGIAGLIVISEFCLVDKLCWDTRLNDLDLDFTVGESSDQLSCDLFDTNCFPLERNGCGEMWCHWCSTDATDCSIRHVWNCPYLTCLRVDSWVLRT